MFSSTDSCNTTRITSPLRRTLREALESKSRWVPADTGANGGILVDTWAIPLSNTWHKKQKHEHNRTLQKASGYLLHAPMSALRYLNNLSPELCTKIQKYKNSRGLWDDADDDDIFTRYLARSDPTYRAGLLPDYLPYLGPSLFDTETSFDASSYTYEICDTYITLSHITFKSCMILFYHIWIPPFVILIW